jgi:hypothetical protein
MKEAINELREWSSALNSGEYPQGTYVLYQKSEDNLSGSFCCLGVLGVVLKIPVEEMLNKSSLSGDVRSKVPISILDIFKINPKQTIKLTYLIDDWNTKHNLDVDYNSGDVENLLVRLNDSNHLTFPQIAIFINEVLIPYMESL